jgi:tripartite ATP-independent transporter DctM subunit
MKRDELQSLTRADIARMARDIAIPALIALWVLGSIYGGIASVTESAGIGALGAVASAWLRRELTWALIKRALLQTMTTVGVLLWLAFGANALIGIYNIMGGTGYLRGLISGLPLEPIGIIVVMMLILVVLGMFMDWIGILLLTMPIFVPVATELGFDPVWFGILFCMNMQASYLTPPFGPAAFYLKSVAPPEITMQLIFRGVLPFVALQLIGLLVVLLFPQVALWPLG